MSFSIEQITALVTSRLGDLIRAEVSAELERRKDEFAELIRDSGKPAEGKDYEPK